MLVTAVAESVCSTVSEMFQLLPRKTANFAVFKKQTSEENNCAIMQLNVFLITLYLLSVVVIYLRAI